MGNLIKIDTGTELIQAQDKTMIDVEISTAKAYPRDEASSLKKIEDIATRNSQIAAQCFYLVPRGKTSIEGVGIRFAEIVAKCWGNLKIATRIIKNDGKKIVAQGIAYDLENNVAASQEVEVRITDKEGRMYSDDMQIMAANAAASKAYRNALFKVVPPILLEELEIKIKKKINASPMDTRLTNMFSFFAELGLSEQAIMKYLNVRTRKEITSEMVMNMTSIATALKEGDTTIEEVFFSAKTQEQKVAEKKDSMRAKIDGKLKKHPAENANDYPEENNEPNLL
jgi:hypothetical protein